MRVEPMFVETASEAGAKVLFTEDLQDGQEIHGLRAVNPFRNTGEG